MFTRSNNHAGRRSTSLVSETAGTGLPADQKATQGGPWAFTLSELLVVMAIIAVLATIGLPALKGFGKGNAIAAAQRQMLDDLAYARLKAISGRTTVYVVFVPSGIMQHLTVLTTPNERRVLTNLVSGQYSAYALFSDRRVGAQPGEPRYPRYLTEWRRLPDGMLIATNKFDPAILTMGLGNEYLRSFTNQSFPFPVARSSSTPAPMLDYPLPYIAFNALGQLVSGRDELIPLAQGSVFYTPSGQPDVVLRPPNNYTNNYVRINWLTGRASMDEFTRASFK